MQGDFIEDSEMERFIGSCAIIIAFRDGFNEYGAFVLVMLLIGGIVSATFIPCLYYTSKAGVDSEL